MLDYYHTSIAILLVFTTYIPPIISRAPDFVCTDDYCCSYTPDYSTILLWKETRCGLHILNFLEKKKKTLKDRSLYLSACTCMLHFTICWDSFFRRMYLFLFWEWLCELFIRVSEGLLPEFSQNIFCMYRQFFKEINAKQSLEYWKLHITFSCIFPFLKVRLVQRYFKRGPNAQNKVRLLKDINAKQSPFRYLNTGNYNVFMHFPFSF